MGNAFLEFEKSWALSKVYFLSLKWALTWAVAALLIHVRDQ